MSLLRRAGLFAFLLTPALMCSQSIPASDAAKHLEKQETVYGKISESFTATKSSGTPTFISPTPIRPSLRSFGRATKLGLEPFHVTALFASKERLPNIKVALKSSYTLALIGQYPERDNRV